MDSADYFHIGPYLGDPWFDFRFNFELYEKINAVGIVTKETGHLIIKRFFRKRYVATVKMSKTKSSEEIFIIYVKISYRT